jgi:hypothetical protein
MSANDNQFLNDPMVDPKVEKAAATEVLNAMSAVSDIILEHGRFYTKLLKDFEKMFKESGVKFWIIFAGVGGVCELARILWDGGVFLWTHLH